MITDSLVTNRSGERIDFTYHQTARADALVILGHGLTGNKDRPLLVALAEGLAGRGWPCLRISYTGNGESEGNFTDSCITKQVGDLQALLDLVPNTASVAYIGHSMGAAVGVLTAARDLRIRVLVSLAGMTHTRAFVEREFSSIIPGQGNMWDEEACPLSQGFVTDLTEIESTLSAAESLTQPWLLIHGDADDVVPVQDGRDACDAAICEKKLVDLVGAGHSFDEALYPQLVEEIDLWLKLKIS
jgi:pimeloyl-ACP methyl ester carboxylesterase